MELAGVPELDDIVGKLPTKRVGVPKPDAKRIARFVAKYRNVTLAEVMAAFDLDSPEEAVEKLEAVEEVSAVAEGDTRFWRS